MDKKLDLEKIYQKYQNNKVLKTTFVSFDHPLYILFSSGTTGLPKCITHSHGGVTLQHLKELSLHTNISSKDNMLFFTTCGWMMWNWMVSNLLSVQPFLFMKAHLSIQMLKILLKL